jgi:hypothetical protein
VPLAALISLGGPLYCAQLFSMQSSIMLIEGNRSSGNDAYFIIAEAENVCFAIKYGNDQIKITKSLYESNIEI